jgi:hypothetical protein
VNCWHERNDIPFVFGQSSQLRKLSYSFRAPIDPLSTPKGSMLITKTLGKMVLIIIAAASATARPSSGRGDYASRQQGHCNQH